MLARLDHTRSGDEEGRVAATEGDVVGDGDGTGGGHAAGIVLTRCSSRRLCADSVGGFSNPGHWSFDVPGAKPAKCSSLSPKGHSQPPKGQAWPPKGQAWPPKGQAWPPKGQAWPPKGQAWPPKGQAWPPKRPIMASERPSRTSALPSEPGLN